VGAIAVFCGSSGDVDVEYTAAARRLGCAIAERKLTLFYGGGASGMMGAVAEGCLASGGKVVGVIPEEVKDHELPYACAEIHWVRTIDERKETLINLADALIVLPGGLGTLDELFFVIARSRMGLHSKPCGILNTREYFQHLSHFLEHVISQGFAKRKHVSNLYIEEEPKDLVDALMQKMNATTGE